MLGCQSVPYCFGVTLTSGTSPILEVGIPHLVCDYILGLQSVTLCL